MAEEEKREAQRQTRKLEFLISQTELYSHSVGNKLKNPVHQGKQWRARRDRTSRDHALLVRSHDEFSEWFSMDIECGREQGVVLNEHQLRRLHMILKPFMLRRVKKNVQNELSEKIELNVYCNLSPRQRALHRGLRANVSIAELLQRANNLGDADSARSLMNLVMQFRKVCNHPELFERADVVLRPLTSLGPSREKATYCAVPTRRVTPFDSSYPYRLSMGARIVGFTWLPITCWVSAGVVWVFDERWWESGSAFRFMPFLGVGVEDVRRGAVGLPLGRLVWVRPQVLGTFNFLPLFHRWITWRLQRATVESLSSERMSGLARACQVQSCIGGLMDRLFIERQTRTLEVPQESSPMLGLPPPLRESPSANEAWAKRLIYDSAYRLITKGTIDERIVQLARVKEDGVNSAVLVDRC
ncbi:putative DNA helicase ino80 [Ceratobasidium sp. 414]|nr:putative DNA helicase ino80 [Ceratobasidium sp. 414]